MIFSKKLEEKTLTKMIEIYCRKKHSSLIRNCDDCGELLSYAQQRLGKCAFGNNKPVCSKCPIHCYEPRMQQKIKTVMRYSGPKMILYSPLLTILYVLRKTKSPPRTS